jgi:Gluconate 2-dehydrogenase subunit 3
MEHMMRSSEVNRREALRRIAVGGAVVAAAPLWVDNLLAISDQHAAHRAAAPSSATAQPYIPKVLNAHQNETVTVVSELIIPSTDTPGATAAKVNEYIDAVLADAPPADRDTFLQGIAWLDMRSEQRFNRQFVNAPAEQQIDLLTSLSAATAPQPDDKPGVAFFQAIKGMTITGYYTSEVGLRQEIGDDGAVFFTEFKGCTHPEHGA